MFLTDILKLKFTTHSPPTMGQCIMSHCALRVLFFFQVPNCLLCGSFLDYVHETNFWMSSGGTRSVVHFDADHNLHCMVAGRKDFIMIEKKYYTDLYFIEQVSRFTLYLQCSFQQILQGEITHSISFTNISVHILITQPRKVFFSFFFFQEIPHANTLHKHTHVACNLQVLELSLSSIEMLNLNFSLLLL